MHTKAAKPFSYIFGYSNWHEHDCICPNCLANISLCTEDEELWTCNYCGDTFEGHILEKCPTCEHLQRLFACPKCGDLIDINAEYDEKELEQKRYDKQTELLQQKNNSADDWPDANRSVEQE